MKRDKFYRNMFIILLTLVALSVIYQVRSLLTPVFSALLVAYILYPVIVAGSRIGIPKAIMVLFIFITFLGGLIYIGFTLIPSVKYEVKVLANPDQYRDEAQSRLVHIGKDISTQLEQFGLIKMKWEDQKIINGISGWIADQSTFLLRSIGEVARETGQFMMIFLFVLVFALVDGDKIYKSILSLIPNSFFEPGIFILKNTTDLLGYYLRGIVIENIILGVISFLMLMVLSFFSKLTFVLALAIAVIISITNVIRIIGPFIGAIIGILLVLISTTDFVAMTGILIVVVFVQFLDNVVILPLVMKEQVKIHPVFCVLSVLMGGILAGVLGMILAIPIIGSVSVIYRILSRELKKFNMDPEPMIKTAEARPTMVTIRQ